MDFSEATEKALAFRRERDWEQFHNQKDLAISINIEAAELLELFQWSGADVSLGDSARLKAAEEELADVVIYCMYFADSLGMDIPEIVSAKIDKNTEKYPVNKSRGNSKKYTEL